MNLDDSLPPPHALQRQTVLENNQLRNRSTRDATALFTGHRELSTDLILKYVPESSGKLCVFGAGNTNDLEVDQLIQRFAEIQLVDLDAEALEFSLGKYQQAAVNQLRDVKLSRLAEDLTGICRQLDAHFDSHQSLQSLQIKSQQHQLSLPVDWFDCIASTCLLSQVVASLHARLGDQNPEFLPLVLEVRRKHFELMIRHLRPGGKAVFISDFVSSVTWPELGRLTPAELNQSALQVIQQGNFFTGCNPLAIVSMLRNDSWFAANICEIQLSPCWCWDLGTQQMAVAAVAFRKVSS